MPSYFWRVKGVGCYRVHDPGTFPNYPHSCIATRDGHVIAVMPDYDAVKRVVELDAKLALREKLIRQAGNDTVIRESLATIEASGAFIRERYWDTGASPSGQKGYFDA